MSTLVTTNAIILGRHPWSETSQILTLVASDLGKLRVVARGARKITSEFGPALEPITESQVVLSLSPRSDLGQVRAADVTEYFSNLKRSFVRVTLAGALCELVERTMPEGEPVPGLYGHVRDTLAGMDCAEDRAAVNWLWRGAYDLAGDLGYGMRFDSCVGCGLQDAPHPAFSLSEGGPVCASCLADFPLKWSPETQAALLEFAHASSDELHRRRIRKPTNHEIRALFEGYFRFHVPGFERLRSLDLLATPS